ncbi:3-carboxymuconate cyclase [Vibrio sp. 10N.286.49.B3]|uniref:lactonase family protein n=1 Tax=Vibrio sp. 10N.286.49.B3 TaxID=1880855 RepID=UPI000C81FE31|nr:lactonase family protein [Vibrio sp. 10N.286.49.B3]PMH37472.1 3-carboxymuconate cyclase [Vibrio sp. 10N.286.49.B3]
MNYLPLTIGCYTDSPSSSQGIYSVQFDLSRGELSKLTLIQPCRNPSFVITTPSGLYAISEVAQAAKPKLAYLAANKEWEKCQAMPISGDHPCHIAIDHNKKYIITSQYSSGNINIFTLDINGQIDKPLITIQSAGSGAHLTRQTQPHAHQCVFLRSLPQFVMVDLGSDSINFYCFDEEQDEFLTKPIQRLQVPPGRGPRHLVFNHLETMAYVVCELSETILVLAKKFDQWVIIQEVDALPNEEKGEATAAIKLSPDEKFLYVSSRHQSKISCFAIVPQTQQLDFIAAYSTQGEFPRDFLITNDGQWVIAANQHSNNLTSFKRNIDSGELAFTGNSISLGAPVCISG